MINISTEYIIVLIELPLHLSYIYSNIHISGMTILNIILTYLFINFIELKASPTINDIHDTM